MRIHNNNRTLEFMADDAEYSGRQYFFQLLLKEEGENAIGFPYYIKVDVEEYDEEEAGGDAGSDSTDGNGSSGSGNGTSNGNNNSDQTNGEGS